MSAASALSPGTRRAPTLLAAQRAAGTLAAVFAFAAAAAGGDLGVPLVALFAVAVPASLAVGERAAHKFAWAWTAVLAAALFALAAQVHSGDVDLVLGAARFAVLLAVHRLWNRKTERDELLLLLLSLLLLCAGAALSAEVSFALAFAGYAVAGTWALALTHLRFQIEAGRDPESASALLRSRRVVSPALLAALAALALLGLFGAGVVFFAFPRVSIGSLHRPGRGRAVAGLTDRIDLSGRGSIQDDPSVVLRVRLDPDPGSPSSNLHFRARAFEVWTGRGWSPRPTVRVPSSGQVPVPPSLRGQPARRRTAELELVGGDAEGLLLTPPGFALGLRFETPFSFHAEPRQLFRNEAGDLFYAPLERGDLRYVVVSQEPRHAGEGAPTAPTAPTAQGETAAVRYPPRVALDLELPPDLDPRVRRLAADLAGGKSPALAAAAVEQWLSRNLAYTRELPGDVVDPVADFLFERRRGHCELFASAMVLLLRAAGIPARSVGGYYGGVRTGPGQYAVRAGDAHSWVEVFIPGAGFIAYDPTPPSARGGALDGLWPRAVLLWDGLARRWRSSVVDYDLLAQARFLKGAGALLQEANRRLSGKAGSGRGFRPGWAALGIALLLSLAALALRASRQGGRPGRGRAPGLAPDQARARKLQRQARRELERAGVQLAASSALREVAPDAGSPPRRAPILAELSARCLAARWGGAELPAEESRRLLRALRRSL